MKELSDLQKDMLEAWIRMAEKSDLRTADILNLDQQLNALIDSVEYELPISYFPRLLK